MPDYLQCPDLGHAWKAGVVQYETEGTFRGVARRDLLCRNCGIARVDYLSHDGRLVARRYNYRDSDYREQLQQFGDRHERIIRVRASLLSVSFDKPALSIMTRKGRRARKSA